MKLCIGDNEIENVKDLQALRMSGLLYLLGKVTGYAIFDEDHYDYNESLLLESLLKKDLPKELLARWIFYKEKNDKETMRYAEGLFCGLYLDLINKEMAQDVFLKEIRKIFFNEVNYLKKVNNNKNLTFSFPVIEEGIDNYNVLKKIKKDKLTDIRMTGKRNFLGFKNKKALYLNKHEKAEGIFLAGSCGSGKTMAALSMLSQILIKGGGGLYFTQDYRSHWEIVSCLKSIGREDDYLIYNIHTFEEFLKLNMASIVEHNKVVVLQIPSLEKDPCSEETITLISRLQQFLFLKFQDVKSLESTNHFAIIFEELIHYLINDNKEMFHALNDLLKNKGIIKIYQEQDSQYAQKSLDFIKHWFLMKQEAPCSNFIRGNLSRDLTKLNPGEFFYTKDLKNVSTNANFHVFLYFYFSNIKHLYLNTF